MSKTKGMPPYPMPPKALAGRTFLPPNPRPPSGDKWSRRALPRWRRHARLGPEFDTTAPRGPRCAAERSAAPPAVGPRLEEARGATTVTEELRCDLTMASGGEGFTSWGGAWALTAGIEQR